MSIVEADVFSAKLLQEKIERVCGIVLPEGRVWDIVSSLAQMDCDHKKLMALDDKRFRHDILVAISFFMDLHVKNDRFYLFSGV